MPSIIVSTDVVLFSIQAERLEVLLAPVGDAWRLPGGDVSADDDLDACARRVLTEATGFADLYLEQLYTFGRPGRDPAQRAISVSYFAITPLAGDTRARMVMPQGLTWHALDALPTLTLDHQEIVALAHHRLANKLAYSTIALRFMPEHFTLPALQAVYETILGESLDKRNFRKRVLAMACIEPTDGFAREGNHRPARLYRMTRPGCVDFIK